MFCCVGLWNRLSPLKTNNVLGAEQKNLCEHVPTIILEKTLPPHGSHLFLICAVQVPPFLNWLGKVKGVHGYFNLADDVVFGEAIKVVHRHHQSLAPHLLEWNLEDRKQFYPLITWSGKIWQFADVQWEPDKNGAAAPAVTLACSSKLPRLITCGLSRTRPTLTRKNNMIFPSYNGVSRQGAPEVALSFNLIL